MFVFEFARPVHHRKMSKPVFLCLFLRCACMSPCVLVVLCAPIVDVTRRTKNYIVTRGHTKAPHCVRTGRYTPSCVGVIWMASSRLCFAVLLLWVLLVLCAVSGSGHGTGI